MTRRVPLLSGTRLLAIDAPAEAVVLRPPPPGIGIVDVGAAVREALSFPLSGPALEQLVTRGGRATVVVEPPALPIPSSSRDPREAAIEATVDELTRLGVDQARQTLLVASGLHRRPGRAELGELVAPEFARRFRGRVEVHDAADPGLVTANEHGSAPVRVHPALTETDLLVVVSAAETVLHGGPAVLAGAADARTLAGMGASSLLETRGSPGWDTALRLERALSSRVACIGLSLALHPPQLGGPLQGYPFEPEALRRLGGSLSRRAFGSLPGFVRRRLLDAVAVGAGASAVLAGPPSVAHAEALLRAINGRSAPLEQPLDAICIGVPETTPYVPRERPNPLLATYLGLGLALRLWRDASPIAPGGTAILVHRFHRRFAHPTQHPYRAFFGAVRSGGRDPQELDAAAAEAALDPRALESYRAGRSCHPLLPFADWAACRPALERLGAVLVAGCRDAVAARQLGFVPTHGVGPALAMAEGRAGGRPRIGFLLVPPFFPLRVGGG